MLACTKSNFSLFQEFNGKQYPLALPGPAAIAANAKAKGYTAVALIDEGTVSGVPQFISACNKVGIKPIVGCSFDGMNVICRNRAGWERLIALVSEAHNGYTNSPHLKEEQLPWRDTNFIITNVDLPQTHYLDEGDWVDFKTVLCSSLSGCTLNNVKGRMANTPLYDFFCNNNYFLRHSKEVQQDELLDRIENETESFKVSNRPQFPDFPVPAGTNLDEYLRELCRKGWREKIQNKVDKCDHGKYADRVKYELSVLQSVGLSSYFLIVQDFMLWAKAQGWVLGRGRGSAAGCLVSYLLGITEVDPIPYGLIFERFYNAGRNTVDKVSPPDIDCDVPSSKRGLIIDYITKKYGQDKVAPIITFQTMQGRGSLKDVLRVTERCDFSEMNRITKFIPDREKVSDQLKDMEEAGEAPSIILWTLKNRADALKEWAFIDTDGQIKGEFGPQFAQAIRLEGCKKGSGKHAAGLVVSKSTLSTCAPMVFDRKTKSPIVGFEMDDLDTVGLVKFDILGLSVLDKLELAEYIIRHGKPPDS